MVDVNVNVTYASAAMSQRFTISDLSKEFSVTPRTLRFYEEKGLLTPTREGQNRVYSSADRSRLRLILRGKRLGFTLEESQQLIEMYQPSRSNKKQLQAVLNKIREKRSQLEDQLADLKDMQLDLRSWEKRYLTALADGSTLSNTTKNR